MMKLIAFSLLLILVTGLPDRLNHLKRPTSYIVGGTNATYGEFPYQISLQNGAFGFDYHICGGAIYNEYYVITAAHCIKTKHENNHSYLNITKVYAGDLVLYTPDGHEQVSKLKKVLIHPKYNPDTSSNDIALLKLKEPLDFSGEYVKPIAMPEFKQTSQGNCILSGWGDTSIDDEEHETMLKKVSVPVISDEECNADYGTNEIKSSMLCAGTQGKGGCRGDDGGPLVCTSPDGITYLAGIGSWAYGCAKEGYPAVYTEISYYVKWLKRNT